MARRPRTNVNPQGLPTQPGQVTPTLNVNPQLGPPTPGVLSGGGASQPLSTLDYKTFLGGRMSQKPLAIQFAKLTKNAALLRRLTATPGGGSTTAPTGPIGSVAPPIAPAVNAPPSPAAGDPQLSTLPASPDISQFTTTTTGLPTLKTVPQFPSIDALYSPAERMIASQRAAALAAQGKAFNDNQAFEQFIQNSLNQGNTALAGTMGQLSQGAATSRQQSMDNITNTLGQMNLAAGGNADLQRLAGSTAAAQSNPLLQAGQSAQNAVPDLVGQAQLKYAQDQGQVGAATGRVMNDAAIRATQEALGKTAEQATGLQTAKAGAQLSQAASLRDYMVNAAQLDALNRFNSGKLTVQQFGNVTQLYGRLAQAKSRVDVASINKDAKALHDQGLIDIATMNNINKLAAQHLHETATTNRTLISAAAKRQLAGTTYGSQGTSLINNILRNQTQSVGSQDRQARGQTVTQAALGLKNSFVVGRGQPMNYSQAYDLLSAIPKAGPEALKDPQFVAWLKTQFPS